MKRNLVSSGEDFLKMRRPDILEAVQRLAQVSGRFATINLSEGKQAGEWLSLFLCPFHDDPDPSLGFNIKNNTFHCFGCGLGGTSWTLVGLAICGPSYSQQADYNDVLRWWHGKEHAPVEWTPLQIKPKPVFQAKKLAAASKRYQYDIFWKHQFVKDQFGLDIATTKHFHLGWWESKFGPYITIPHYRSNKSLVGMNARYAYRDVPEDKIKYILSPGSSRIGLYNGVVLLDPKNEGRRVYVVEDEKSVWMLHQHGELAVAYPANPHSTTGNINEAWLPYFEKVVPVPIGDLDRNEVGQITAANAANALGVEAACLPTLEGVKDFADLALLYPGLVKSWLYSVEQGLDI